MLVEIKMATRTAHGGGRLTRIVRERLVFGGADTMALLGASVDLWSVAAVARFDGDVDPSTTFEAKAGQFSAIMRVGGWLNALGEHPSFASEWAEAVEYLASDLTSERLWRLADPGGSDEIASIDLAARTALMRIDLLALVDGWPCGAVEPAGHFDHGWQTVSGRIYGDPRFGDGQLVTFYGLPAPDLKMMRHLGRPGSSP